MPKSVQIVTILIGADPTTSLTRVKSWPSIPCVVRVPSQFMAYTFDDHSLKKMACQETKHRWVFPQSQSVENQKLSPWLPSFTVPSRRHRCFPSWWVHCIASHIGFTKVLKHGSLRQIGLGGGHSNAYSNHQLLINWNISIVFYNIFYTWTFSLFRSLKCVDL